MTFPLPRVLVKSQAKPMMYDVFIATPWVAEKLPKVTTKDYARVCQRQEYDTIIINLYSLEDTYRVVRRI